MTAPYRETQWDVGCWNDRQGVELTWIKRLTAKNAKKKRTGDIFAWEWHEKIDTTPQSLHFIWSYHEFSLAERGGGHNLGAPALGCVEEGIWFR